MPDIAVERRALALFEAMLELDEDEQQAWLEQQIGNDEPLRRRVTEIIDADRRNMVRTGAALEGLEEEPPPERIGAYRIEGLIGAGGMGSVYAAERDSGDFAHSVAIKLIKPGILSDALVARFNRERQILAQLNHPRIARLFDGGTTGEGQPYFVMERVDGVPLMDWIERTAPSEDDRIALFVQICEAAGYAHRNLVVHRDLTPANILVEQGGEAKLIDFGIARPDGEEIVEAATSERTLRALTLTPGFAAPERLRGEAATTLSDIYSAGRMLARMIDKPRPREIQAIISKAIADDPERRYLSMDQLADDVRRYRACRPVSAMPAGTVYRLHKWIVRNQPLAALAALLAVAVAGGVGATAWYWQRAEAARAQAEDRFGEVRSIAKFMLFDLYDQLEPVTGNTKALSHIADEARAYLQRLAAGDNLSPDLRFEIAQGYHRLSNVSGNPEGANLGRRKDARVFLDKAIGELRVLHRADPADLRFGAALADAEYSDAILRFIAEEDNRGAISAAERAAALYRALLRAKPKNEAYRLGWLRARLQAAKPMVWIDRGGDGVRRLEALRKDVAAFVAHDPDSRAARRLMAATDAQLGYTRAWHLGAEDPDYDTALPPLDEAVETYDALVAGADDAERTDLQMSLLTALFERSLVLSDLQRWSDALSDLSRAEPLADGIIRRDPDDEGALRRRETLDSQKIFVFLGLGRKAEAVALALRVQQARVARSLAHPENAGYARDVANARQTYADALQEAGRRADACRNYRHAEKAWDAIEARWSLSSLDREYNVVPLRAAIEACSKSS